MDTYQSPDDDVQGDLTEHPQYDIVLKMVLWGEKREDIYHRMKVNGLTGSGADALYSLAWKDRVQTIRAVYSQRLLKGAAVIVGGIATFVAYWHGMGSIPKVLIYGCSGATAIGLWKFVDGIIGYLMAETKEGSVAEDF